MSLEAEGGGSPSNPSHVSLPADHCINYNCPDNTALVGVLLFSVCCDAGDCIVYCVLLSLCLVVILNLT